MLPKCLSDRQHRQNFMVKLLFSWREKSLCACITLCINYLWNISRKLQNWERHSGWFRKLQGEGRKNVSLLNKEDGRRYTSRDRLVSSCNSICLENRLSQANNNWLTLIFCQGALEYWYFSFINNLRTKEIPALHGEFLLCLRQGAIWWTVLFSFLFVCSFAACSYYPYNSVYFIRRSPFSCPLRERYSLDSY